MTQVFISYSRKDLAFVERLAKDLKVAGLEVWYDLSGLEVGQRWGSEIQKAIRNSRYFIAVLSPNSVESEWVEREFLYSSNQRLKVIPLLYKPCDLPMWCLNLHYIDVQGRNYKRLFPDILRALEIQPAEAKIGMEPVAAFPVVGEPQEEQTPVLPVIEKVGLKITPFPAEPPASQEPLDEGKALKPEPSPRQKVKIRPFWILIPIGLLAVIAFLVWGLPPLAARPEPSPSPTRMVTNLPTSTWTATWTRTSTPTSTYTPTLTKIPNASPTPRIGSTWLSSMDYMVMVYVPAGDFSMGSENGRLDELPVHTIYLDAFWIDQTEVTNHMYDICVAEGACLATANSPLQTDRCISDNSMDSPVTCVDWNMANTYCQWAGRRLPSEAEWEKAARGTDGRTYPWGNAAPTCTLANLFGMGFMNPDCVGHLTPVGNYPAGASPYGALDMAGNAWEWVNDWYSASYYRQSPQSNPTGPANGEYRVVRGVSWGGGGDESRSAYRLGGNLADFYNYNPISGFRCSRSAQ